MKQCLQKQNTNYDNFSLFLYEVNIYIHYVALLECNIVLWESKVTNVISTQRHI